VHIIGDSRIAEFDGGVLQEFFEQLLHAIGPTFWKIKTSDATES
jgi:hypothetical protein